MKQALVIDDNTDNTLLITFILKKSNYRTIIALDGKTGIDLAKREKPDFILVDLKLPDMNGLEIMEEIRKSDAGKNLPIIAMIADSTSPLEKERLIETGFTGCIERPIDSTVIIDQIKFLSGNGI